MRKRFILLTFGIICSMIFINGYFNKAKSNASGAPQRETGSPGDGGSCQGCHSGHPTFTGRGTITTNIPSGGYTAATTYTITATIYSPALVRGGFELSPQDTTGARNILGTISAGSNTQVAGTGYITHTSSSNTATSGTITWTMNWKAPATGKGPVVFYAAFNRSNDNGSDSGDSIYLTTLKVYEDICTTPATPGVITGNTSVCASAGSLTYSVAAVTGATSYVWTLPSGWTGTSSSNSITVTAGTAGGNITVKASNNCGTSAASTQAVTVTSAATASVSVTEPQTSICSGQSLTFTATPTNGGASPTYAWQVSGSAAGINSNTFTTTTLTNGQVVECIMTSDLACVTGSPATSNTQAITVTSPVTPSVSIGATSQTICQGANVTFTATPINGGATPTYQWKKNGVNISGATGSTYSSTTLANGDAITVVMTSNATCVTTATATSTAITMVVNAMVTPSVSITSNSGNSICGGQTVTLTATPVNGGNTPTYQWYKNGAIINGATNAAYTTSALVNNDSIKVVLTSNASCTTTATATSNSITFNIVSNATPAVTIASNANGGVCAGTSITFTAAPVNGGTTPTYAWYKNGTVINGATSATYTSTALVNNDSIWVVLTSNSACVSTTTATSNKIGVSIVSNITPSVSISSGSGNSVCSGSNVTFNATPVNGGNSPTYQWYNGSTAINGATLSSYSSTTLTNGEVISVSMTSSSSCAVPSSVTSSPITVSVTTSAAASVTVNTTGNTVCTGQAPTFTAVPVNGGATPGYQWFLNGNSISGATTAIYTPSTVNNADVFTVQLTSSATCVTQSVVSSGADTVTVAASGTPTVSVSANPGTRICQGTTVTFTAANTFGGSSPTYQWLKNGSNVGNNAATYIDNALVTADVITCSITSSLSCASPATALSNSDTVTVNAPPVAAITVSNDTLTSTAAVSYQWYQNNIIIGSATGQNYVAPNNGSYSVVVTDANGCQNSASVNYVSGIADITALANIKVYPNPADRLLFVDLSAATGTGKVSLRIFNLNGQMLLDNENALTTGEQTSLNIENLPAGIYILQISQGQDNAYKKLIVSK